jgi:hypothetical protein
VSEEKYVIKKNGLFYRENSSGYTSNLLEAGVYSKSKAVRESLHCEDIRIFPISSLRASYAREIDAARRVLSEIDAIEENSGE